MTCDIEISSARGFTALAAGHLQAMVGEAWGAAAAVARAEEADAAR
jgi:hypothetical protein